MGAIIESAQIFHPDEAGIYDVKRDSVIQFGPGNGKAPVGGVSKGIKVRCYGHCSKDEKGKLWLLVSARSGNRSMVGYIKAADVKGAPHV